ncbi:YceI family protein [Parerythrobacter lacustris]|uniref:YceI family protein n=1 Tax=Parerythrobacter lacustris TaxID=2969984 RepID=A0ABT1XQP6_9SPHN|nr:YceI family protein [Parerythrobacter lacustris]MCR2833978.1 YceI family protein [Parerythrobacter lacustris]
MIRKAFALALAGSTLVAVSSISAQEAGVPGAADISRVTAGRYAIDANHTQVGWRVSHFGFNDYLGLFGEVTGTMELDPANVEAAKFDITIPITSVAVSSAGLKDHLLRAGKDGAAPDFFGPAPASARFVSTNVRRTGDTSALVTGQLTMNGKTGPVAILVDFTGAGLNPMNKKATVGFEGTTVIDRTQWGVGYGVPAIGRDVELNTSVAFEKQ